MRTSVYLAVALSAVLAGCNSQGYDLAQISGTVTLDGKPIPGTLVNFQPVAKDGANPGPGSTGRCDESGRYELRTIRDQPGAVVGSHRVRIYSFSPESPVSRDSDMGLPKEQFPNRYNYASELTFDVQPDGTDAADFRLSATEQ